MDVKQKKIFDEARHLKFLQQEGNMDQLAQKLLQSYDFCEKQKLELKDNKDLNIE